MYIKLFHGRRAVGRDADGRNEYEELHDWGTEGPAFGPYSSGFHVTYACEIKFGEDHLFNLSVIDGMVYYDGVFYGDWTVVPGAPEKLAEFDQELAEPDKGPRKSMTQKEFLDMINEHYPDECIMPSSRLC